MWFTISGISIPLVFAYFFLNLLSAENKLLQLLPLYLHTYSILRILSGGYLRGFYLKLKNVCAYNLKLFEYDVLYTAKCIKIKNILTLYRDKKNYSYNLRSLSWEKLPRIRHRVMFFFYRLDSYYRKEKIGGGGFEMDEHDNIAK